MKSTLKIMIGLLAAAVMVLSMGLGFISCQKGAGPAETAGQTTLEKIIATKNVKMGIITTAPPYAYLDENNEPTGYDFKFASELAKALVGEDGEIEYVDLLAQNRAPALQTGEVDVGVFCMGNFPERAKLVHYSSYPYFILGSGILARADLKIETIDDLAGIKVAVVKGTNGHEYIEKKGPKGVEVHYFDDDILQANALLAGQVDAITTADGLANQLIKENPDKNLEWKYTWFISPAYVVVRHGDYDLMNVIDSFIISNYFNGNLEAWWDEYMTTPYGPIPGLNIK